MKSSKFEPVHRKCFAAILMAIAATMVINLNSVHADNVVISGDIKYQGRSGAEGAAGSDANFNSRGVQVEVFDKNGAGQTLIGTGFTNNAGHYEITVPNTETGGDGSTAADIFVRINPKSEPAAGAIKSQVQVVKYNADPAILDDYKFDSAVINDVLVNQTIDKTFDGGTNLDHAFSVFDSFYTQARYHDSLPGAANNSEKIRYGGGDSTYLDPNNGDVITIVDGDRFDWDVAGHEYGHWTAKKNGFNQGVGGNHTGRANLRWERGTGGSQVGAGSSALDFRDANKLAFGEGFATYNGIVAQIAQGITGIQRAGDVLYHDNDDADGITIDTAASKGIRYSLETKDAKFKGFGEDDETSVMRILLDLNDANDENDPLNLTLDHDRVSLGSNAIWNLINTDNVTTLNEFWSKLIVGKTNSQKIDYGAIFQSHNVSATPDETSTPEYIQLTAAPPTLKWKKPKGTKSAGGTEDQELMDHYGLKFFDSTYAEIAVPGVDNLGNVDNYTLTAAQWDILKANNNQDLYWIVLDSNKDFDGTAVNFETGPYWSDAISFAIIPEPSTVTLLMLAGLVPLCRHRWPRSSH